MAAAPFNSPGISIDLDRHTAAIRAWKRPIKTIAPLPSEVELGQRRYIFTAKQSPR